MTNEERVLELRKTIGEKFIYFEKVMGMELGITEDIEKKRLKDLTMLIDKKINK